MRPLAALALLVSWSVAAPVPKNLKGKLTDAELFVGTWKCTSEGRNNKVWTHTHTFDADGHLHHKFGENGTSDWDWSIDPEQTPKVFKFIPKGAKQGGYHGIYELDGDTLRIAYTGLGSPLPKDTTGADGCCLFILTRQPAK